MRMPYGFGSVCKLSGKRSKPYVVRVTVGYEVNEKTGGKKQIMETIGYVETKRQGRKMLESYHLDGRLDKKSTFKDVFYLFLENEGDVSHSKKKALKCSFNLCEDIHNDIFSELRLEDLQETVDSMGKNYTTLTKVRTLFRHMYSFAIMQDIVHKDYSESLNLKKHMIKYMEDNKHSPRDKIKEDEIEKLWTKHKLPYYQIILILIYTGVRVSELLELRKEDVHLDQHCFDIIASKTKNGIRKVPIADKIYPFVESWYHSKPESEYLVHKEDGGKFTYRNYYDSYFKPLMLDIGMIYSPHYCRHTFISMMVMAGVDQAMIKKIVGHNGRLSLTERIYTHFEIQSMLNSVNKI